MNTNLLEIIKEATETTTGCNLLDTTRRANHVQARNIFYKVARENSYTLQAIGDFINKDHASVIHGLKKFECDSETDKAFRGTYQMVLGLIDKVSPNEGENPSKELIGAYEAQNRFLLSRVLELEIELDKKIESNRLTDIEVALEGLPQHRIQSFKDNQLASFVNVENAKMTNKEAQEAQDERDIENAAAFEVEFETKRRKYVMKSHKFDYAFA